jgi:hypothetical protein
MTIRGKPVGSAITLGRARLTQSAVFCSYVVFIVPFNWWAFLSNSGPLPVKVLVGLLDIGLVIGAIVVIRRLLATLKYGHSQISFNRFPFFLGEKLDVTFSPVPFETIDLTLRFVTERYEARGSGKNRSRQFVAEALWSETRQVKVRRREAGERIEWQLPDDLELNTQLIANPDVHYWELLVEAAEPGIDFKTTFPVPVYAPTQTVNVGASGQPWPPLTRYRHRRFEVVVAAAFALAVIVPLVVVPGLGSFFSDVLPRQLAMQWAVKVLNSEDRAAVGVASIGDYVYAATQRSLGRYSAGTPGGEHVVWDKDKVRANFTLSSINITQTEEIWLGGYRGGLRELTSGRTLAPANEALKGRIEAVASFIGDVYVAATRLYRSRGGKAPLVRVPEFPKRKVSSLLVVSDNQMFAGHVTGVWRFDGQWRELWRGDKGVGRVTALARSEAGELFVGTTKGVAMLDAQGKLLSFDRVDSQVEALAVAHGSVWVGTRKHGLWSKRLSSSDSWTAINSYWGLPGVYVNDISFDSAGNAWLAVYSGGVTYVPADALRAAVSK